MRKILALSGFTLLVVALLTALPGSAGHFSVRDVACDVNTFAAAGAADALSNQAITGTALTRSLLSRGSPSGIFPCGKPEGRRVGIEAMIDLLLNPRGGGDREYGVGAVAAATAQRYADLAATAVPVQASPERGYVWARAVMIQIRLGFTTVPGGAAEAFNRIQTCLDGRIVTNQGNRVAGVLLDCSKEVVRRAVSDVIAPGFYVGFGSLPAVDYGCDDMLAQATGGRTREARWAGAQAYILACDPDLSAVAASGGSAELRFAAVAPLASQLAGGSTAALLAASRDRTLSDETRLANAWAAGLRLEKEIAVDPINCAAVTRTTGNLYQWSLARLHSIEGQAAIAPLARYYHSEHVFQGNRCSLGPKGGVLTLTIAGGGGALPLYSGITTLP
jgi:hypothetical protein